MVWWDGTNLGTTVCLVLGPDGADKHQPLAAAQGDRGPVFLRLDQIGGFLETHAASTIVTYDAATFHWSLVDAFHCDEVLKSKLGLIWSLSRDCRLVDIAVLHLHLLYLQHNVIGRYPTLDDMARDAGLMDTPNLDSGVLPSSIESSSELGRALLSEAGTVALIAQIYRRLQTAALEILTTAIADLRSQKRLHPAHDHWFRHLYQEVFPRTDPNQTAVIRRLTERFGLLGTGIDVKAAIALRRVENSGMVVDADRWALFRDQCLDRYRGWSATLKENPRASRCFHWSNGEVAMTRTGLPEVKKTHLNSWLRSYAKELHDVDGRDADIPRNVHGEPSTNPEHWGVWASSDRWLSCWRELCRFGLIANMEPTEGKLHPCYTITPYLREHHSFACISRIDHKPFVACPNRSFLILSLKDVDLCCLSVLSRPDVHIPSQLEAAMAFDMSWKGEGESILRLGEKLFEAVWRRDPTTRKQPYSSLSELRKHEYTAMAYGILRHVPYGSPVERLRQWLDWSFATSFSAGDIREMQDALVNRLFPDVGAFLRGEIPRRSDEGSSDASNAPRKPGTPGMWGPALTLRGRLTRRTWSAQVVRDQFMMSVDEVIKDVIFRLTLEGYKVAAVYGHSIVLDLSPPPCLEDQASLVKEVVRDVLMDVLGSRLSPFSQCELTEAW